MSAALTAFADGLRSLGVQEAVAKPFSNDDLVAVIARLVAGTPSVR
jgi:cytochrome c553